MVLLSARVKLPSFLKCFAASVGHRIHMYAFSFLFFSEVLGLCFLSLVFLDLSWALHFLSPCSIMDGNDHSKPSRLELFLLPHWRQISSLLELREAEQVVVANLVLVGFSLVSLLAMGSPVSTD